jgi:hypothetical protein
MDPLRPVRGIFNGIALSVPVWAVIALLVWMVCK